MLFLERLILKLINKTFYILTNKRIVKIVYMCEARLKIYSKLMWLDIIDSNLTERKVRSLNFLRAYVIGCMSLYEAKLFCVTRIFFCPLYFLYFKTVTLLLKDNFLRLHIN